MKNYSSRLSVLTLSMIFLIIFFVFDQRWAALLSLIIGVSGIASSRISKYIESGLTFFTKITGFVIQTILLSVLFFLILFPISVFYRLFNKDNLMLSPKYPSFFVGIKKEFRKESLEKPW
jgi:hypothetical protein